MITYSFRGNIEGNVAVCNIASGDTLDHKLYGKPIRMYIPASYCIEDPKNTILISKSSFNKLDKACLIIRK